MPLFELDGGMLVPAQFGRTVDAGVSPEILASVRDQVLEIIGRPLFPICWTETQPEQPRLTALDASGQVVAVEVLPLLDSVNIIDCLSRLAETAQMGWNELAHAFEGGVQAFRFSWAEFRNHMPPSPAPGPRLILVAGRVAESVRPVLDVLATSGVEVHELTVREMANGRRFVEVQAVGPRLYGHNPNLLLQGSGQLNLPAAEDTPVVKTEPVAEVYAPAAPSVEPTLLSVEPTQSLGEPTLSLREPTMPDSESAPEQVREPENPANSATDAETLLEDETGLYAIGQIVGVETDLVWQFTPLERYWAKLSPEGVISGDNWSTKDPDEAILLLGSVIPFAGWEVWRLGSADGPTLREALQEINKELAAVAAAPKYSGRRVRRR